MGWNACIAAHKLSSSEVAPPPTRLLVRHAQYGGCQTVTAATKHCFGFVLAACPATVATQLLVEAERSGATQLLVDC